MDINDIKKKASGLANDLKEKAGKTSDELKKKVQDIDVDGIKQTASGIAGDLKEKAGKTSDELKKKAQDIDLDGIKKNVESLTDKIKSTDYKHMTEGIDKKKFLKNKFFWIAIFFVLTVLVFMIEGGDDNAETIKRGEARSTSSLIENETKNLVPYIDNSLTKKASEQPVSSATVSRDDYTKLTFEDFWLDKKTLIGEKIMVSGFGTYSGDMLFVTQNFGAANLVSIDTENLSRDNRRTLLKKCTPYCNISVTGVVSKDMFDQIQIIASKTSASEFNY